MDPRVAPEWFYIYCVFTKKSVGFWCADWEEAREKQTHKKIHLSDFRVLERGRHPSSVAPSLFPPGRQARSCSLPVTTAPCRQTRNNLLGRREARPWGPRVGSSRPPSVPPRPQSDRQLRDISGLHLARTTDSLEKECA